ncbi:MAG TPA: hypothetical protein VFX37_01155 [Pseudolabrys sp.]|nr:hypothetical protein [Pseudolabrys sp.]
MAHISHAGHPHHRRASRSRGLLGPPLLLFVTVTVIAAGYVCYVLWPRWPSAQIPANAPAMPIVIGGVTFNIEPAAIRMAIERRSGTQARVDLSYLWPSLVPPDPAATPTAKAPIDPNKRLFVTIAAVGTGLPPLERVKTIYPLYLERTATAAPDGLSTRAFRDDTPYQGEDLIYDSAAPEKFFMRCTRKGVGNAGICLDERRIDGADITLRFPRDWLKDWKGVAERFNKLVTRLHPG